MSELGTRIAQRIRTIRHRRGWSQSELARAMGISRQRVHAVEKGDHCPQTAMLPDLALTLGVSTDYLLGVTDDPQGGGAGTALAAPDAWLARLLQRIRTEYGFDPNKLAAILALLARAAEEGASPEEVVLMIEACYLAKMNADAALKAGQPQKRGTHDD